MPFVVGHVFWQKKLIQNKHKHWEVGILAVANASRNFLADPKNFNFFSGTATSAMDRASVKY